jgi:pimeloyl-ACP methyl ester carboxylesterase
MGDAVFDEYYASNVQFQSNTIEQEHDMQGAGAALLDRIGPAILLSHSQGGLFPQLWADVRPQLVKAVVTIEPTGPCFKEAVFLNTIARPWGLNNVPLSYVPTPTNSVTPLATQVVPNDSPGLATCIIQAEPARQLANLKMPFLLVTSQASYHAVYDDCTFKCMAQAGIPVTHMKLVDHGIYGNGHLMFMETNSEEIASLLEGWITLVR